MAVDRLGCCAWSVLCLFTLITGSLLAVSSEGPAHHGTWRNKAGNSTIGTPHAAATSARSASPSDAPTATNDASPVISVTSTTPSSVGPLAMREPPVNHSCTQSPPYEYGMLNPFALGGRLGNSIFQYFAISLLAQRWDIRAVYTGTFSAEHCVLGLLFWTGGSKLMTGAEVIVDDGVYSNCYLHAASLPGVLVMNQYYQMNWLAHLIRDALRSEPGATSLYRANPWRARFDANNDTYVHIRLGDTLNFPSRGAAAFIAAIGAPLGRVYVASDSPDDALPQPSPHQQSQ